MLFQLNITFLIFLHSFCFLFPFSFQVRHEIVTDLFREIGNVILGTGEMMFLTFGIKLPNRLRSLNMD